MAVRPHPDPAGAWLVGRYPRWWRERYAAEVLAMLDDAPADWRARLDLAHGAIDAHLRGDGGRSPALVAASLVAGAAWTLVGIAGLAQRTPLDWPGYAADRLPLLVVAAFAFTIAQLGLARRAWSSPTRALEVGFGVAALAGLAWTAALAVAALGGPYGAVTAAVQAVAAVAMAGLGLAVMRVAAVPGSIVVVMAVALVVPTPAVWLAVGAGWTTVGVLAALGPGVGSPPSGAAR